MSARIENINGVEVRYVKLIGATETTLDEVVYVRPEFGVGLECMSEHQVFIDIRTPEGVTAVFLNSESPITGWVEDYGS